MDNGENVTVQVKSPKVFISYAWGDENNKDRVRELADRLRSDGVDAIFDQYDLKEGDNRFKFMERSAKEADFVLILCDKAYRQKADDVNARVSGVWAEASILTPQVYGKKDSSHIIPVYWELPEDGDFGACSPIFVSAKYGFDFSTQERQNQNYERLLRRLFGYPEHEKPALGEPPAFLTNKKTSEQSVTAFSSLQIQLSHLKEALGRQAPTVTGLRRTFLKQCYEEIEKLKINTQIENWEQGGTRIGETYKMLSRIRTLLCEWLWTEVECQTVVSVQEELQNFLEQITNINKRYSRSSNTWDTVAHNVFIYDLFLHIIAILVKLRQRKVANELLSASYLCASQIKKTDIFWIPADNILRSMAQPPQGKCHISPAKEILQHSMLFENISISDLTAAEVIVACKCYLLDESTLQESLYWYPQLIGDPLFYDSNLKGLHGLIPKAITHDGFKKFGEIFPFKVVTSFVKRGV